MPHCFCHEMLDNYLTCEKQKIYMKLSSITRLIFVEGTEICFKNGQKYQSLEAYLKYLKQKYMSIEMYVSIALAVPQHKKGYEFHRANRKVRNLKKILCESVKQGSH